MNKNWLRFFLLLTAFITTLTSCSTLKNEFCVGCSPSKDTYESGKAFDFQASTKLRRGMSIEKVLAIMGKPYTLIESSVDKQWIWSHSIAGKTSSVTVQFKDSKLLNISRRIDK